LIRKKEAVGRGLEVKEGIILRISLRDVNKNNHKIYEKKNQQSFESFEKKQRVR